MKRWLFFDAINFRSGIRWMPVALLLAASCITPIDFEVPGSGSLLVVDGSITNRPGPYTVKLFKSFVIDNRYENPVAEFGAKVTLFDDQGNSEELTETDKGIYKTKGLVNGQLGRAYHITIRTREGKEYFSEPEKIEDPGQLDSLYFDYVSETRIENGVEVPYRGFRMFVDAAGSKEENLIRWRWTGTYEILTFPELHVKITDRGPVADPLPCSGYKVGDNGLIKTGPCLCCTCWINMYQDRPLLSDEQFINAGDFRRVPLAFIPLDRRLFYNKFHFEVEQLSLSRTAYEFWKAVRDQRDGSASLFQPPNAKARGNIRSKDGEEVLGLFSVGGVSIRSLFLNQSFAPDKVLPIDTIKGSCLKVDPTSTINRPEFW